jgi:NTE family protein
MTVKKPEYGLVLSGGGARGLAHIGVIAALEKHGISAGVISGSSMGAIVGAFYAGGISAEDMLTIARKRKLHNLFNWSFPKRGGMLSLNIMKEQLQQYIPEDSFQSLKKKLFITVSNLSSGAEEVISSGELYRVVIASASIPVVFEPQVINGQTYVDGGLFNDLPVDPLVGICEKIIASHVNYNGPQPELTSIRAIAERVYRLAIYQHVEKNFPKCDFIVDPPELREHGVFDFKHIDRLYEIGYIAAEELISQMNNRPVTEKPVIVRDINKNNKK